MPESTPKTAEELASEKALNDRTKAVSVEIANALAPSWEKCAVKTDEGKIDLDASRRAFGFALRSWMKAKGLLVGPSSAPRYDAANIRKALYSAFVKVASPKNGQSPKKQELCYATCAELQVPPADMESARRAIERVLDESTDRYTCVAGKVKWEGIRVTLVGTPSKPEAFQSWDAMTKEPAKGPAVKPTNGTRAARA